MNTVASSKRRQTISRLVALAKRLRYAAAVALPPPLLTQEDSYTAYETKAWAQ